MKNGVSFNTTEENRETIRRLLGAGQSIVAATTVGSPEMPAVLDQNSNSVAQWLVTFELPALRERSGKQRQAIIKTIAPDWQQVAWHGLKEQIFISPDELAALLLEARQSLRYVSICDACRSRCPARLP
jgi:hypothetical protein